VQVRRDRGLDPPDWYMERPELERGHEFFLEAFWQLSTCRQVGLGVGPIPWTACYQYGLAHNLDCDMLVVFPRIMMRMDEAYLDWSAREMERKSKAKVPPGNKTVEKGRK